MWCYVVVVHLCLPLDTDAIGIKKRGEVVQAKENKEQKQKHQIESRLPVKKTLRQEKGWQLNGQGKIQIFNKRTCDLGTRKGIQCNVHAFDTPHPHHMLQSPANETHFRVQWVELFKASCLISQLPLTLLSMRYCWPDGGAIQNNKQLLLPFLKVPDIRNPTGLAALFWCPCSTIKGYWVQGTQQKKGSPESSGLILCCCRSFPCVIPFIAWWRTSLKLLVFPLLLQTESSSRIEFFWRLVTPAWGHFWLVSAH